MQLVYTSAKGSLSQTAVMGRSAYLGCHTTQRAPAPAISLSTTDLFGESLAPCFGKFIAGQIVRSAGLHIRLLLSWDCR